MDEVTRLWGANIRRFRQAYELTQNALAEEVGVSQATIARWEDGQFEPSRAHKVILAEVLRTDVSILFPLTRAAA